MTNTTHDYDCTPAGPPAVALAATLLVAWLPASAQAQSPAKGPGSPPPSLQVASPNRDIVVTLTTEGQLAWSIAYRGAPLTTPSPLALVLDGGRTLGAKPVLTTTMSRGVDTMLTPPVRYRRAEIRDRFNETPHRLRRQLRAHRPRLRRWRGVPVGDDAARRDHGRWARRRRWRFAGDHRHATSPKRPACMSHQERAVQEAQDQRAQGTASSRRCPRWSSSPGGPKVAITEADLFDYPGMDLTTGRHAEHAEGPVPRVSRRRSSCSRDRDERVHRARGLHREDEGHARLPVARARRRRARRRRCSTPTSSTGWRPRRRWPTRAGSSRARSRGTGGTATTSTACRSAPA